MPRSDGPLPPKPPPKKRKLEPTADRATWHKFDRTLTPTTGQRTSRAQKAPTDLATVLLDVSEKTWWFKIWVGNGCSWEQVESQRSTVGVASCDCPIAWRLTYMIAKCHQLGVFDTLRMDPDSAETWKKCFQEHTSALKELRTQVVSNPEGSVDNDAVDKFAADAALFEASKP